VAGLLFLAASAFANPNVTFSTADFLGRNYTNRSLIIAPVAGPFIDGTNVIATQSYTTNTGSGSITISNMVSGTYRVTIAGNPSTTFLMTVPTGDDALSASALVVNNPPAVNSVANGILSSYYVRHTNGNLVSPTNFFRSNITAAGSIGLSYTANGGLVISNAASGGGGGTNQYQFLVATNYVNIQTAPSSNSHVARVQDLRNGSLVFLATFEQTNGVGSNVVAGARPKIGTFRHATGVGAVAPNGLIPAITNNSLTYQPISNAGTIYIGYGAEGTNPIRRVRMLFRYNEVNGSGTAVAPLVHLVGNGEYVAAGDLLTHGGFSPQFGTVSFDAHLGGFGSFTFPTTIITNGWAQFPNFLLETQFRQRVPNVFEYWIDGTNLLGHVNGWQFSMPYTNGAAFGPSTNLIVQFFAPGGNALTARTPEIMEIAAWDTPYPGPDNEANFAGMVQGQIANAAFYGSNVITSGTFIQGTGSNAILAVTTGQFTNLTVGSNGTLDLNGDRITGTYTNAGTNVGGVYQNVSSISGTNLNLSGTATMLGLTVTNGGTFSGIITGATASANLTNFNSLNSTNAVINIIRSTANLELQSVNGSVVYIGSGTTFGGVVRIDNSDFVGMKGLRIPSTHQYGITEDGTSFGTTGTILGRASHGTWLLTTNAILRGSVASTNGVYYPTNTLTATQVLAGLTNGGTWVGMISNALHAAYMTNGVTTWKVLAP
jgi:hypothetical protein